MTNEQPMQPRYLCVSPTDSHYPYSPFKIGDIITMNQISCNGSNCCTINGVVYSDVALDKYPHLFRRLKWWEFRDEKDMPEYVKCNMSPDNFHFPGYVYKIQSLNGIWYSNIQMAIIFETNCYTPATKEEYDNQKTITMTAHQIIKDEVELLQSWIDQSKTGGWSTHLVKPMEDRILYLQKIRFELSSPSSSAGVWVRASERLPDVETSYHVKIYGRPGFAKWYSEKMEFGFEATNGFGTLRQDHFEQIEWLDESPVSTPSVEGMAEAWVIEYDNDTGPGDEYFVEWFNVTNGEKSFRCNTKEDAEFLLASLSSPGSGWVKVEDGLPEIPPPYFENGLKLTPLGCRVIVYDSVSKEVYEANYYDGHFDDNNPDITHWQPLPTPPGVEDNQTKKQ